MIYTGKQIRVVLKSGEEGVYRGSYYTVAVTDANVSIYGNGRRITGFRIGDVKSVTEDNYGGEQL